MLKRLKGFLLEIGRRPQVFGALEDAWRSEVGLELRGWLLLDGLPCEQIELISERVVVARARAISRPDLAHEFRRNPRAAEGGFELLWPKAAERSRSLALRMTTRSATAAQLELVELDAKANAAFPRDLGRPVVEFSPRRVVPSVPPPPPESSEPGALYGVSIDTTSVCNLRCTICALERNYDVKAHMPLELFSRLDDAFAQLRHISFSLNAEPLLNRQLEAMIARAKQRSRGRITTSLATNAMLLDAPRLHALAQAGLDALEISLDGITSDSYLAVRIGADFERLVANIERAAALEQGGAGAPHVSLRWVMSKSNFGELPALLEFAAKRRVRHVVINGLEPYTAEQAALTHFDALSEPELRQSFEELEARAAQLGLRLDLPRLRPEPFETCELIEHACVIRVDGQVAPCSPLSYAREFHIAGREERHPLIAFGSIAERSLLEIWNDPQFLAFRTSALVELPHAACKTCLKRAGVICPLKHWNWLASGAPQPRRSTVDAR